MRRPICLTLLAAALLAGCTDFSDLEAAISEEAKRADYPVLVPAADLLNKRSLATITEATGQTLQARADRLKGKRIPGSTGATGQAIQARTASLQERAKLLRGQPIDDETRARLSERLRRLGG